MGDPERSSRREVTKLRVLALIEQHPELEHDVDLGDLVARYRQQAPESSEKFWETDWETILEVLESLLSEGSE